LKTYFMMYLIFDGKRFVADPKPANMAMLRKTRSHYVAALVDLDNVYGEGVPQIPVNWDDEDAADMEVFSPAKDLISYGFKPEDVIRAAYEVLGAQRAEAMIRHSISASFASDQLRIAHEAWKSKNLQTNHSEPAH